ncbi:glycosyltransferase family 2 protein [Flavobacterium lacisediminis]|uniref:Glycosyltransferase family 2 protein n=1 Tax=Flavobacterium lacisediminis TaxID=2989705 RepID=A0ABT3EGU9_9FLAO|nr:glycosyltransferase family 2 protein [Flavobacterium lacisediminis]MCW1147616.1 glycosyltransferase family 2 protein [Flavobacterium lacisediminis]
MPKISVIIPLYNKGFIISETLKSVLAQTFTDFEVVIVNDGSTDNSFEIVSQFSDERIKLFQQQNKGAAAARNLGIEKATGELIAFLDADDYWNQNHLDELYQLYIDFPNSGVYCNRYQVKTTSKHFQKPIFNGIDNDFRGIVKDYFFSNRPFRINITLNQMIPRRIILEMNCFTTTITNGQDLELWTKIGIKYEVALNNKYTSIYNYYLPNSLSKNKIKSMQLMDFSQFEKAEQKDIYLKEFLDLHRFFYAIQYKSIGDKENALLYYTQIAPKNLTLTNKILFSLPSFVLQLLYKIKRLLKKIGIEFSTYN